MSLEVCIKKKLKGFSLDIEFNTSKEILGILGSSGSGKSMTLRCIAGIDKPDEGRIVLNGRVLFDSLKNINLKPQERNVGYLFQNYALFPHMTVEQNIRCGLYKEKYKDDISSILELVHLSGMEKRYPRQLSGGQQQRAALARILASKPEVLLLDEPFSALDSYLKEEIQLDLLELLENYNGQVAMVTHNRDEAYRMCKNIMVVDKGRVKEIGSKHQIFNKPQNVVSARLTGCKNISRANKIDENHVYSPDWNVTFKVTSKIPENLKYIGIRAHNFLSSCEFSENINCQRIYLKKYIENMFDVDVLFSFAKDSDMHIWWKFPKNTNLSEIPNYIGVRPEDIMLLES